MLEHQNFEVNRRKFFRHTLHSNAHFRVGRMGGHQSEYTSWGECLVEDISGGGARISTNLEIPVGLVGIFLNIEVSIADTVITLNGRIVRRNDELDSDESEKSEVTPTSPPQDKGKQPILYGVEWANSTQSQIDSLVRALNELQMRKRRGR